MGRPGSVIYDSPKLLTLDAGALTWHVSAELRVNPSAGGSLVNSSALNFEVAVQAVVEKSIFKTPQAILELRGRTLRIAGRSITDVDAFVVVGKKLFLISCKRFAVTVEYGAGDYKTIRNAQTRVDEAIADWAEKMETLRASPKGDNYDLTSYEIDGFVLIPELIFSASAESRETIELGVSDLFFTRLETIDQFMSVLEMASRYT
jgi:hypothetical protein